MLYYENIKHNSSTDWVVFIHGAGGSTKTWQYQVDTFKKYFNILLIDLRDHGNSKFTLPTYQQYTFEIISKDINGVLDQMGIDTAYFVTLSFGSVLVQDFNSRYPEKVKAIVFCGAIFKGNLLIKSFVQFARFLNLFLKYETMYKIFSYLLMPKKRNQLARRIYQMQSKKLTQDEYMKWIGLYGEFFRLLKNFYYNNLNVNSLVIMGGDDFVFLKAARKFTARQATAKLRVIDKAGHVCNIDARKEFNSLALQFLLDENT